MTRNGSAGIPGLCRPFSATCLLTGCPVGWGWTQVVAVAVAVAVILLLLLLLLLPPPPQQAAETGMGLATTTAGEPIQLMGPVTSHGRSKSVLWSVPC